MATVAQVAKAALQRIVVQGSEAPLEASEYADFIDSLNNYMTSLDASGIDLGYTVVTNISDTVTVPAGALRGIIANMAIEVAPDYGAQIPESLVVAARQGLETMRLLGQRIIASANPSTLPRGSGNYQNGWGTTDPFYPDLEADILADVIPTIGLVEPS